MRSHTTPADGWVQFAEEAVELGQSGLPREGGGGLRPYFCHVGDGRRRSARAGAAGRGRASGAAPAGRRRAAAIAKVGRARWGSEMGGEALVRAARQQLQQPAAAKVAARLAHQPCPADELVVLGQLLGLDAQLYPELMWLADVAMSAELPVGWLRHETAEGKVFFWNAALGVSQWEHPQVAYLTGVTTRLVNALARVRQRAGAVSPSAEE